MLWRDAVGTVFPPLGRQLGHNQHSVKQVHTPLGRGIPAGGTAGNWDQGDPISLIFPLLQSVSLRYRM